MTTGSNTRRVDKRITLPRGSTARQSSDYLRHRGVAYCRSHRNQPANPRYRRGENVFAYGHSILLWIVILAKLPRQQKLLNNPRQLVRLVMLDVMTSLVNALDAFNRLKRREFFFIFFGLGALLRDVA